MSLTNTLSMHIKSIAIAAIVTGMILVGFGGVYAQTQYPTSSQMLTQATGTGGTNGTTATGTSDTGTGTTGGTGGIMSTTTGTTGTIGTSTTGTGTTGTGGTMVTPGAPETGFGGNTATNIALLTASALVVLGGAAYVARKLV